MLPLAGETAPTSTTELADALQRGLGQHGVTAEVSAVGEWPALESLLVRLSRLDRPSPLPKTSAEKSFSVERFQVVGAPVLVEGIPASVRADFVKLGCGFAKAATGPLQLVVTSAESGALTLEAAAKDVEQAIHRIVSELADKQGATVKSTSLTVKALSPRSLEFEVSCTAKVFIASATLSVTGQVAVDEQLNARLDGLRVKGDGMIASMAQSMIQPRLSEVNGRVIPLGDYVAAGLRVSELNITTGDQIRVEAKFAGN